MARTIRYRDVAADLERRIESGEFAAGRVLPSENEMGAHYEVSRVTVRRSLELLRDSGIVDSRQGFGWFVAAEPLTQELGLLETIETQLAEAGREWQRKVLAFGFVDPPAAVVDWLGDGQALEVRRVNLADGEPFALVTVWCPEDLGASMSRADVERSSFHDLIDTEVSDATQTIRAVVAGPDEAEVLAVPVGSPLLRCWRRTRAADGRNVLVSEQLFPGHLTELAVDLAVSNRGIQRPSLRLVDDESGAEFPAIGRTGDSHGG